MHSFKIDRLRCSLLIITLWFLNMSFAGAQTSNELKKAISLSTTQMPLSKAMSEIESQTRYTFALNSAQVDITMPVKFSGNQLTLAEALNQMLGGLKYKYIIRNGFIGIIPEMKHPERANPVARAWDNTLTSDRYTPTNPNNSSDSKSRGDIQYDDRSYEIERIITLVPGEAPAPKQDFPAAYSAYQGLSRLPYEPKLPELAIKTNLLYAGALLTPNLSMEMATAPRQTFEFSGSYQWWGRKDSPSDTHKQLAHWMLRPEYRWWTCERFNGHYFGAHALYSRYYVSGRNIPLLFDKKYSYDGHAVGAGVTYGYHLPLSKNWAMEFNIGAGYVYMWFDRGNCSKCTPNATSKTKHYVGPTRAGINLIYIIK